MFANKNEIISLVFVGLDLPNAYLEHFGDFQSKI
jgi:hypothetical protein